mmetsp:Transcript_59595/g.172595  ORF Transcript_59595/g.172595 Transcript_59595/m.172595 type:complete len:274 (-) Transcript_59595:393-1214(-)
MPLPSVPGSLEFMPTTSAARKKSWVSDPTLPRRTKKPKRSLVLTMRPQHVPSSSSPSKSSSSSSSLPGRPAPALGVEPAAAAPLPRPPLRAPPGRMVRPPVRPPPPLNAPPGRRESPPVRPPVFFWAPDGPRDMGPVNAPVSDPVFEAVTGTVLFMIEPLSSGVSFGNFLIRAPYGRRSVPSTMSNSTISQSSSVSPSTTSSRSKKTSFSAPSKRLMKPLGFPLIKVLTLPRTPVLRTRPDRFFPFSPPLPPSLPFSPFSPFSPFLSPHFPPP